MDSSPFVSSWHLNEPLKGSAIQESPTSNIFQRGRDGKLNKGCTVHKGFNPNCVESRQKENSEASDKGVNSGISSTLVLRGQPS